MAYCQQCGKMIADGSQFCPGCGAPTAVPMGNPAPMPMPVNPYPQQMAMGYPMQQGMAAGMPMMNMGMNRNMISERERSASLNELNRMAQHFSQKQDQYDEYDRVSDQIDTLSGPRSHALLVWGIILLALMGSSSLIAAISTHDSKAWLWFAICCIPGVLMITGYILRGVYLKSRLRNCYARYDELSEELEQHFVSYGYCPVGMEYSNPKILELIYNVIRQGRADTPKEAINVLLIDAHRSEMELYAAQTAAATRSAARRSGVAAAFCAASFFLR